MLNGPENVTKFPTEKMQKSQKLHRNIGPDRNKPASSAQNTFTTRKYSVRAQACWKFQASKASLLPTFSFIAHRLQLQVAYN